MQRKVDTIERAHVDLTHTVGLVQAGAREDRVEVTRGHRSARRKARAGPHEAMRVTAICSKKPWSSRADQRGTWMITQRLRERAPFREIAAPSGDDGRRRDDGPGAPSDRRGSFRRPRLPDDGASSVLGKRKTRLCSSRELTGIEIFPAVLAERREAGISFARECVNEPDFDSNQDPGHR